MSSVRVHALEPQGSLGRDNSSCQFGSRALEPDGNVGRVSLTSGIHHHAKDGTILWIIVVKFVGEDVVCPGWTDPGNGLKDSAAHFFDFFPDCCWIGRHPI